MTANPNPHVGLPSEEEIKALLLQFHADTASAWRHERDGIAVFAARAILSLIRPAFEAQQAKLAQAVEAPKVVQRIAEVANAVGWQASVGASETAGLIVSVLAANPEQIYRFMQEGSELFIDGTMRAENGCLSHHARNGQIVQPTKLREIKGQSQ